MRFQKRFFLLVLLLLALLAYGCGSDSNDTTDGDITDGDTTDGDTTDGDETDGDEDTVDGDEDTTDGDDDPACVIDVPEDEVDMAQKKFALSMFHYNIQYVAGGLETEIDGEMQGMCGAPCLGWTDERLNDWIVTESFEPVLDFYIAHPDWRVTFEMQGLMLEWIGERFPEILEKLRDAAMRGQVEIVSFHYAAQLFLAFPELDLVRSQELTKAIFEKYCVPLSGVVFNQEGEAGEGKHAFMKENGYQISVFPKNLYNYVRMDEPRWPYYKDHDVDVIIGPSGVDAASGIEVSWVFFDDGELLTTPLDPYFAFATEADLGKLAEYEEKLQGLADSGYKITSISDYVRHLKGQGIEQPGLPPVIDGTWQPRSTSSVLRWMGGRSLAPYNNEERDNYIRTSNYQTRTIIEAAEIMISHAETEGINTTAYNTQLTDAWRNLSLAQTTDITGITPWPGEFNYGVAHNTAARDAADTIINSLLADLDWPHVQISLANDTAEMLEDIPMPEPPEPADAPFEVAIHAPTRETTMQWFVYGQNALEMQFTYGPGIDPTGKDAENTLVRLDFPRFDEVVRYSPALMDDTVVEYPFTDFTFEKPEIYLPLANGLLGLGNNWWVIKDCRYVHLAPRIANTAEEAVIQFIDETADPVEPQMWRFIVFQGSADDALALAKNINTEPLFMR